jgi:hypothetical protein
MKQMFMASLLALLLLTNAAFAADPLPSWNETTSKKAIVAFVEKVTIGRLDKALDEAQAKGWTVVDMKQGWNRVLAFERP